MAQDYVMKIVKGQVKIVPVAIRKDILRRLFPKINKYKIPK